MSTVITKEFKFEAAHQLPNHKGKCKNKHGHSYIVQVSVTGVPSREVGASDEGMVMDFADLKGIWTEHVEPWLDHKDLNETIGPEVDITTAERIAEWIYDRFFNHMPGLFFSRLHSVTVYETATSAVTYRP